MKNMISQVCTSLTDVHKRWMELYSLFSLLLQNNMTLPRQKSKLQTIGVLSGAQFVNTIMEGDSGRY